MESRIKSFSYLPTNLIKVRRDIERNHIMGEIDSENQGLRTIEEMIREINELRENQVEIYVNTLNKHDVDLLIRYISKNIYEVDLEKLKVIIEKAYISENLFTSYNQYQNYYNNKEVRSIFIRILNAELKERMGTILKFLGLSVDYFKDLYSLINQDNPIDFLKKKFLERKPKVGIDRYISNYRFEIGSAIYVDFFKELLFIADREQYMKTQDDIFLEILNPMTIKDKAKFLNNYMIRLSLRDYSARVLGNIHMKFDNPRNKNFDFFWKWVSEEAKNRYLKWYKIEELRKFFNGDERFSFWYSYLENDQADLLNVNDYQLFLEFDGFYVVEFRDIGNAAYIYPDYEFEDRYMKKALSSVVHDNSSYKAYNNREGIVYDRILHTGEWQRRSKSKIEELIYYGGESI